MPKMSEPEPSELGARVDAVAQSFGSRTAAAEAAGVTVQQLGRIVSGRTADPSARTLGRLAQKSGVSLDWLVLGQEPKIIPHGLRAMARFQTVRGLSMVEMQRAIERDKERVARVLSQNSIQDVNEFETHVGPGELIRAVVSNLKQAYEEHGLMLSAEEFEQLVSDAQDRVLEAAVFPEQWLSLSRLVVWEHVYALSLHPPGDRDH